MVGKILLYTNLMFAWVNIILLVMCLVESDIAGMLLHFCIMALNMWVSLNLMLNIENKGG